MWFHTGSPIPQTAHLLKHSDPNIHPAGLLQRQTIVQEGKQLCKLQRPCKCQLPFRGMVVIYSVLTLLLHGLPSTALGWPCAGGTGLWIVRDRSGSRRSEEDANSYQEGRTQSLHTDVPVFFLPLPCFAFRRRTTSLSLVSQNFSNKLPRTRWFAVTNVLIPVLETKFSKSWHRQGPWSLLISHRKPFLVSSSF